MGFYIRKAVRVGALRFNLSKSGVGVSTGVRGFRVGTGPRGNYVHMGAAGVYFRSSLGPSRSRQSSSHSLGSGSVPSHSTLGPDEQIDSASVLEMNDSSSAALLSELNEKRQRVRLMPFAVVLSAFLLLLVLARPFDVVSAAVLALIVVGCWFVSTQDAMRRTTVILYDLESDAERAYQLLHDAFNGLQTSQRTWHVESKAAVRDRKYHSGASNVAARRVIALTVAQPPLVRTNVEVPMIPVGKQTIAFLPDRLLVFEKTAVGAVGYDALSVELRVIRFIDNTAPGDGTVIGTTWQYVNKQGGPDRRFKNNAELPICHYDQVQFGSPSGLNEIVQFSRQSVAKPFVQALESLRNVSLQVNCESARLPRT